MKSRSSGVQGGVRQDLGGSISPKKITSGFRMPRHFSHTGTSGPDMDCHGSTPGVALAAVKALHKGHVAREARRRARVVPAFWCRLSTFW